MPLSRFLFLIVFMMTISACEKENAPTLLSQWKKPFENHSYDRKLAALNPHQCVRDSYSVTTLKTEVLDLEENYKGLPAVQGSWRHLDLSTLPVPQANFLNKYGSVIGDRKNSNAIDFSSCRDVPCIFNRIYGKTNEKAGYVHYLWYLKFGNLLAADNMVPGQKSPNAGEYQNKQYKLDQYLWLENELYGFWRISHSLPAYFTQLKFLKEVQRIPPGEWQEGNTPDHCGQASNSGFIVLMDGCLKMTSPDAGYFYTAVTHELGHHLDFTRGSVLSPPSTYFSYTPEYLNIAEIDREEYMDEGSTKVRYVGRPGAKYINEYAKTSPAETYAEMIGYSRFNGELAKKKTSSMHFDFIRNTVFNGIAYDNQSYWLRWGEKYSSLVNENVLKAIVSCQKNPASPASALYLSMAELPENISPALASCLQIRTQDVADLVYSKSMNAEFEGCILMKQDENQNEWNQKIKDLIILSVNSSLMGLKNDPDYVDKVARLFDENKSRDIRDLYLSCLGNEDVKSCYEKSLKDFSLKAIQSAGLDTYQSQDLLKNFMDYYPMDDEADEVASFYRVLLDSSNSIIKTHGQELWNSCKSFPADDSSPPSGRKFTISEGYMVSSLYNCLNVGFDQTIQDIFSDVRYDGKILMNDQEKSYLRRDFNRDLNDELNLIFSAQSLEERSVALNVEKDLKIDEKILSDLSWIKVASVQANCREKAISLIPFAPYFALKKDLFKATLSSLNCQRISSTPQVSAWVETNKTRLNSEVLTYMSDKVLQRGFDLRIDCEKKVPEKGIIDSIFKSKFDKCFEDGWKAIEDQSADETSHVDIAFKLKISYESLSTEAAKNRKTWMKSVKQKRP